MKLDKRTRLWPILIALFICVAVLFAINRLRADPSQLFREFVLDPIPASVSNLKADQPKTIGGYGYTFRFTINRADLALIVSAHSLSKVYNAQYDSETGYLRFDWGPSPFDGGIDMPVYGPMGKREPSWFTLETWYSPEAYVFRKEQRWQDDTRVLLYIEKLGEAYFLAFNRRG